MIRRLLAGGGVALALAASIQLGGDTRYVMRARQPVSKLLTAAGTEPAGVVFIFQPRDCLASGELVARWNTLHREGMIPVRGLVVGDGSLSAPQRRAFNDLHVTLPVHAISARDAAIVGEKLGYALTPFAVVLDRRGRVTASFPATMNVPSSTLHELVYGS